MTAPAFDRIQNTLERLLEIPGANLRMALSSVSDVMASAFTADKVDAFVYDAARDSLVALGTSHQPLSERQRRHGLDILPVSNGGRVVHVYQTGATFVTGRLDQDPEELRGIKDVLEVRSTLGVPLRVGGITRGVLMMASQQPDFFKSDDVRLAEHAARWVGLIVHRAELIQEIASNATEQGRRSLADDLITVLAHDLRNYIVPLELRVALVRRRVDASGRTQDSHDLGTVQAGLRRLSGMIADLLDVSRIDRGVLTLRLEPVDVIALLRETAAALATPDCSVVLEASEDLVIPADGERLRQCLDNLIANAVQHSPAQGRVVVKAASEFRQDEVWARIEIIDQGPGVPADILPRIFERFVTGKARKGGLGLGLHLAKEIARIHGGDLTVESVPGQGARFSVHLPGAHASVPA